MKKRKKEMPKQKDLPFFSEKTSGKFDGETRVVYSFSLPVLKEAEFQETADFLSQIKEAYLSYLEKKSKEKREGIYLGTLSFSVKGNLLTLFCSFSPFEEKKEREVARLLLSEKGKLLAILS